MNNLLDEYDILRKKLRKIKKAQSLLIKSIELLSDGVDNTIEEPACSAYIIPHLSSWAHDREATSFDNIIRTIRKEIRDVKRQIKE